MISSHPDEASLPKKLRRFALAAGAFTVLGALVSLLGWVTETGWMIDWFQVGITIKANTTICLMAMGVALMARIAAPPVGARIVVLSMCGLAATMGGLTLLEHISGFDFGIDTLIFDEAPGAPATAAPGRMGPPASTSFVLLGAAMVLSWRRRWRPLAAGLAVVVAGISALSLVGYLYGAKQTFALFLTGISFQTVIMLLAVALGTIAIIPEAGPMRLLRDRGAAGTLLRRALPVIVIMPLVLGGVRIYFQGTGVVDLALGTAFLVLSLMALLCALLWSAAGAVRKQEASLRDSEERFKTLTHLAPVGIFQTDAAGRCLFVNKGWIEITEIDAEEARGPGGVEIVHPEDRERVVAQWRGALEGCNEFASEYRFRTKRGRVTWVYGLAQPIRDEAGATTGFIGAVVDISERKQAEESLRQLAEDLGRSKKELLAANTELEARVEQRTARLRDLASELTQVEQRERRQLAHFLHDGLQQIIVAARMLLSAMADRLPEARDVEQAKAVMGLLDNAIESSRSLTVDLSPPVLFERGLVSALSWLVRQVESRYGQIVELNLDEAGEPIDEDSRVLLFLSVRELLFNSRKHSGTLRAKVTLRCADSDGVEVIVEDVGAGFIPWAVERRNGEGGFGLFSIRERLRLYGGDMQIDSAPEKGTRIIMSLPRCRPLDRRSIDAAAARPAAPAATTMMPVVVASAEPHNGSPRPIRVLIADDHAILRQGLALVIGGRDGVEVVGEAADGAEALEMTGKLRPDVVLMDVSMPRMGGVEATGELTARWPQVKVIGLSMHEDPAVAESMRQAGAADYLIKGTDPEAVLAAIQRVHEAPQTAAAK